MSEGELLELAARAAGWKGHRSKHGHWYIESPDGKQSEVCLGWPKFDSATGEKLSEPTFADALGEAGWHPLVDEGDRYRLAQACELCVNFANKTVTAFAKGQQIALLYFGGASYRDGDEAECIVRAAAEIEKRKRS